MTVRRSVSEFELITNGGQLSLTFPQGTTADEAAATCENLAQWLETDSLAIRRLLRVSEAFSEE